MAVRSTRFASLSTKELEEAMAATPLLEGVPARAVGHLGSLGRIREYRRGTYLFFQGDDADSVLFLCKGRIEISSLSVTGHRQLLTTLDHPQFFGELGVLGDLERTSTAMALEDTSVWVVRETHS
ncbi:MAG TPA: cyclic nucleotide-binding domain-containing protein [Actinomycetota bacterium]|nr:cyclic nucleotide-binding domain-containing protein [Actinomycetota bacterium]